MNYIKKFVYGLLAISAFAYIGYLFLYQQGKIDELNSQIASCSREIQERELETEKLSNTINSLSDDEYIEEVARERLGLVMPSEIIFMDASI